jgi:polysaccharide biosynthesis/export protein
MPFKILLTIIFFSFISSAFAQIVPDYEERSFSNISDSLKSQMLELGNSNGRVNPDEYIIGAGDKLFISISGFSDFNYNMVVNQDDQIFIPKVGGVDLKKKTLTEAKSLIKKTILQYFKDVEVFISLIDFRKIKVSLLGDVAKSSSYILPANSKLMDLIVKSFGLTKTSNYRDIKIINRDNTQNYYDFLSFLRFGDKKNNPLLNDDDIVIVDKVDKIVLINGRVKYPGAYEFIEGETAANLVDIAGGILSKARKDSVELVRFDKEGKNQISEYFTYDEIMNNRILLQNRDNILVREIPDYLEDKYVRIDGYVKYPGYYKIIENKTTLSKIIAEAGGFRKEASLTDAKLKRNVADTEIDPEYERLKNTQRADMTDDEYTYLKAKSRQKVGKVVVDFVKLFKDHDMSEDVVLKRSDEINVPEKINYVIMLGQVINPGNIIYNKDYSVDDYIRLAGGFGWRALKGDVRIIRANTGEWIDADDADVIKPGDTIWVPEDLPGPKFWDVFTSSLQVLGQVAAVIAATVAVIVATR